MKKLIPTLLAVMFSLAAIGCPGKPEPKHKDAGIPPELVQLRKDFEAEDAKQRTALAEEQNQADERFSKNATKVTDSLNKLGLTPDEQQKLAAAFQDKAKGPGGHSPGAAAAAAVQDQASGKVKAALDTAEKNPTPENIADVKHALDDLKNNTPKERQQEEQKAETSAIGDILQKFGPIAAGAACMYFGGEPQMCMAVAKLVGEVLGAIFGSSDAGDGEKAATVIAQGMQVLNGACDKACIEETLRGWGLDANQINQVLERAMLDGGITDAQIKETLKQAKQLAAQVQTGIDCVTKIRKQKTPTVEIVRKECPTLYAKLPKNAQAGLDCLEGKSPNEGAPFDAKDSGLVARCLLQTVGK